MSAIELTEEQRKQQSASKKTAESYICSMTQQYIRTVVRLACQEDHPAEEEAAKALLDRKPVKCPVCRGSVSGFKKDKILQGIIDNFFANPENQFLLEERYVLGTMVPEIKQPASTSVDSFLLDEDPEEQRQILAAIQASRVQPEEKKLEIKPTPHEKCDELVRLLRSSILVGQDLTSASQLIVDLFSAEQSVDVSSYFLLNVSGSLLFRHPRLFNHLSVEIIYKLIEGRLNWLPPSSACFILGVDGQIRDLFGTLINWAKAQGDAKQKLEHLLWRFLRVQPDDYVDYAILCVRAINALPRTQQGAWSAESWIQYLDFGIRTRSVEVIEFLCAKVEEAGYSDEDKYRLILSLLKGERFSNGVFWDWETRKAVLALFVERWRAELFPAQPTERNMKYIACFVFYILDKDNLLGMSNYAQVRQSRQNELFELLVPRDLINCPIPRGYEILLRREGLSLISLWTPINPDHHNAILFEVMRHHDGEGRYSKVAFLLSHGADVNSQDESGDTPLMVALLTLDHDLFRLLLSQPGLVIEQTNNQRQSAFSIALRGGRCYSAWLLVKKSPIYWRRFLIGSAISLTLLAGGAGALLFFFYNITLPALICFGFAGLCLLLATYQFFVSPAPRPSLPPLSERIHGHPVPASALVPPHSSVHRVARAGSRSEVTASDLLQFS